MLVSSARGFPGACCCTGNSIIGGLRFKLVYTRKKVVFMLFYVALALGLKIVMFHIECQFTGKLRPRQKMSAYLGM